MTTQVHLVRVSIDGLDGGISAPTVADARGLSSEAMRGIAVARSHEGGFVPPARAGSDCDHRFRCFMPNHEMDMCGHVTVGAVWSLDHLGLLVADAVSIATLNGRVGAPIIVRQGRAMGRASRIHVDFREGPDGIDMCRLGGDVDLERVDARA